MNNRAQRSGWTQWQQSPGRVVAYHKFVLTTPSVDNDREADEDSTWLLTTIPDWNGMFHDSRWLCWIEDLFAPSNLDSTAEKDWREAAWIVTLLLGHLAALSTGPAVYSSNISNNNI